ncbi:MAG TPA: class I SAM-dependent methyltransferase, partial [Cyclobacteriaceae bacterium]
GKRAIRSLGILAPLSDILFSPFTFFAAIWFRIARFWGIRKMPLTRAILHRTGVMPVVDHYYEPLIDYRQIPAKAPASLLHWNLDKQRAFIRQLNSGSELRKFPVEPHPGFYYNNGSFGPGDAEAYYSIIRKNKPRRILEIGSGFSTLICLEAVKQNLADDPAYKCSVTCVEPYEMPFLEKLEVKLIRKKIEDVDLSVFSGLGVNDILFIDSSHIIRPGGDVTYLILKILPTIPSGVWVHFHDIFLPDDYPVAWLREEFRMWNEQYLLEAFLLNNSSWEIMLAMSYLNQAVPTELRAALPVLASQKDGGSGSFWIKRR